MGVELQYEEILRGSSGSMEIERDARGSIVGVLLTRRFILESYIKPLSAIISFVFILFLFASTASCSYCIICKINNLANKILLFYHCYIY